MSDPIKRESETFRGIVIREVEYREMDKLLTVLTHEHGKVTVCAHGVRSMKSRFLSSASLLCYSEFTVEKKGDRRTLREAAPLDRFYGIRNDLDAFAFSQYACELLCDCTSEEQDESPLLRLFLNTLFLAARGERIDQIKAVFELRLCVESGLTPSLSECGECGCGADGHTLFLDSIGGTVLCGDCALRKEAEWQSTREGAKPVLLPLSPAVLSAMRYVCAAPDKRIFSFSLPDDEMRRFCETCERYLLDQFGRSYETLRFYHNLKSL